MDSSSRRPAREPLVIAHRGASGHRPEHTLAAYELAARMGADCLEVGLVSTRDGVLVARHDTELSGTTDIADRPELADRRTTKVVDGTEQTGWFVEDLTLAEVASLRAVERLRVLRQRNTVLDGRFRVPTFAEILELRARMSRTLRREIAVYVELKSPTYFEGLRLGLTDPLVRALRRANLNSAHAPIFVQCVEPTTLHRLEHDLRVRVPLVLLVGAGAPFDLVAAGEPRDGTALVRPESLVELSATIDVIAPAREMVIPWTEDGALGEPTSLVRDAHAAGLAVHPRTFRAENAFLPPALRLGADPAGLGCCIEDIQAHLAAGVDGVITDHPDLAVLAREAAAAG